jgi:uncharacterized Zn-binding protein involved in type VI secretion
MPLVARVGDTINTGHGCDTTATISNNGASNVYANGKPLALQGTAINPHTITNPVTTPGSPPCIDHPGQIVIGASSTVRANGRFVARVGDAADLGSITQGATNVFAN